MQQCIKILSFLILNEAQHVSGDAPPIIRSLKQHKQPLVLHNTVENCRACSCLFNHLKTKGRLLYLRPSPYRAVNTFHLDYKNQFMLWHKSLFFFPQINTKHINTVWAERTVVEC
jgi:hypothetical protein